MPELLHVKREMSLVDHTQLRRNIPEVNRSAPDYISLKWRQVGKAAVTLINPGEYRHALNKPNSSLRQLSADEARDILTESIKQHPTAYGMVTVPTLGTEILGKREFSHVVYLLDPKALAPERQALTDNIDGMNGIGIRWREFLPHVSIASVDAREVELGSGRDTIVEGFESIRPAEISFMGARVRVVN